MSALPTTSSQQTLTQMCGQKRGRRPSVEQSDLNTSNKKARVDPVLQRDTTKQMHADLLADGHQMIVGVDEAGRGSIAGPLVVVALHCPVDVCIPGVTDSKLLTADSRQILYQLICEEDRITAGQAVIPALQIDNSNIRKCTLTGINIHL